MTAEAHTDALLKELEAVVKSEHMAKRALMPRRKAEAARHLAQNRSSIDGFGSPTSEIPLESYIYWQRAKPGCWKDKQFVREYLRDNPECRVKAAGTRLQVGYGSERAGIVVRDGERNRRFTKVYADQSPIANRQSPIS